MSDQAFRIGFFNDTILHFDNDRFAAIETGRDNANVFSWEKPADRQRFKRSLCEPFLLSFNGNPKLRRLIVKGCI